MKSIKGLMDHFILSFLLALSLMLFARQAFAAENGEATDGTIEIDYPAQALAPYSQRKSDWSILTGVNLDMIYPDKFRSKIDNVAYDTLFDSLPISMVQIEIGTKYNTSIGSFGAGLMGGYGQIDGRKTLQLRKMTLTKYAATGTYTLDTLFDEPYIAPYISGQIIKYNWEEENSDLKISNSGSTSPAFGITLGALLQLNWIEPATAIQGQTSSGLQNTFIDLFMTQYNTSNGEDDPNFETAMNFGAGLRLEF